MLGGFRKIGSDISPENITIQPRSHGKGDFPCNLCVAEWL